MTTENKYRSYRFFQISYFTVSLLTFLACLKFSQNNPIQPVFSNLIEIFVQSTLIKTIWIIAFGYFICFSSVCAFTYLFFKKNQVIIWYLCIALFLSLAYSIALLPYYFRSSIVNFLFFSINNTAHLGIIICGIKIIQDVTNYHNDHQFHKNTLIATIGLFCCNLSYFLERNEGLLLFTIFIFTCMFLIFDCYSMLKRAVKEKKLEQNFIYIIYTLAIISFSQIFPVTNDNLTLVFNLKLINNIFMPFAIAIFLALVFAKNMNNYYQRQEKIDSLTLEKQAILETQNENLAIQVAAQTSELKALNSTKDRLFSIIGHDLRSPIASLKGILLLIDNQQLSREEFNELLQHLQKNVDNVHGMLENLLQWSMSQMKEMKPSLKAFEINDVIEQTVELFKDVAKQKKIDLQTDLNDNLIVFADENHIRVVVRNLLNNALKFTPENGRVSIKGKVKKNFFELKIIDTGIGINTEEMQLIFSNPKLKQGTTGEKGTGLGLILCRDLIKQNSGKISVKSEILKGTTFEIQIPQRAELLQIQPN